MERVLREESDKPDISINLNKRTHLFAPVLKSLLALLVALLSMGEEKADQCSKHA
jgi:hypothetical protein